MSPVCFEMFRRAAAEEQGGHELSSLFSAVNVVRDLVLTSHKNLTWWLLRIKEQITRIEPRPSELAR